MAPSKFGLFKARSKEQAELPSTENLLSHSYSLDHTTSTPIPSTSHGVTEELKPSDILALRLDSDDEETNSEKQSPRRFNKTASVDEYQMGYKPLKNLVADDISISTLQNEDPLANDEDSTLPIDDNDGASTSYDAKSLQMDDQSVFEEEKVQSKPKKPRRRRKYKSKKEEKEEREKELWEEQYLKDFYMWHATNFEVTQNLLRRSCTLDEQIKWEAIATARGLCALTDNCTCKDCTRRVSPAGMSDGDAGLGAAPLLSSFTPGCILQ